MDDERFYQRVNDELKAGSANEALWTKSFVQAMGDENKARAIYIRLRVQQLMQEEAGERQARRAAEPGEADAPVGPLARWRARIPAPVWQGAQAVIFVAGVVAIWIFREHFLNLGRRLRGFLE